MNGAPWGDLLVKPFLIVGGVALGVGILLGQCARLPDPPSHTIPAAIEPVKEASAPRGYFCEGDRAQRCAPGGDIYTAWERDGFGARSQALCLEELQRVCGAAQ